MQEVPDPNIYMTEHISYTTYMTVHISGLPPYTPHGFHIHEFGDTVTDGEFPPLATERSKLIFLNNKHSFYKNV